MRLVGLYLRSRWAGYAFAAVSCVALLAYAAGHAILEQPVVVTEYLSPVLIFAALLVACLVAASTGSPLGEAEKTASFPLPALRLGHLGGMLGWSALAFVVVVLLWERPSAWPLFVRDLAGLSGMAFIAARLLGAGLSWTLPVAFVAIIPLVGDGSGDGRWAWWAWVDRPTADPLSWTLAAGLFVVGLGTALFPDAPGAPEGARQPGGRARPGANRGSRRVAAARGTEGRRKR